MKQELLYNLEQENARIFVCPKLWNKIMYVTDKYSKEFTALTYVDHNPTLGTYYMYEDFYPVQENSATVSEFDGIEVARLAQSDDCDLDKLSGHIHSHVNMGVGPSKTDVDDIKERVDAGGDFSCSLIVNKKGQVYGHITDGKRNRYFKDVPVEIYISDAEKAEREGEILDLIQSCDSIDRVQYLLDAFNIEREILDQHSLIKDEEKKLDEVIKDRFNFLVGYNQNNSWSKKNGYGRKNGYKNNQKFKNSNQKSIKRLAAKNANKGSEDKTFEDAIEDAWEELDTKDWLRYQNLANRSVSALTDKEFTELRKLEERVQNTYNW